MSTRQLLRNTLYQGKCDLVGHIVSKEKITPLISGEKKSMDVDCDRCNLKLHLALKDNKIIIARKY